VSDDPPLVTHDLARGGGVTLITCGICYCAVVERFWDKHLQRHAERGETGE
jgi:hypothetical protein